MPPRSLVQGALEASTATLVKLVPRSVAGKAISAWLALAVACFVVSVLELLHEASNSAAGGSSTAAQTADLESMATTQTIIGCATLALVALTFWSRRRWMIGSVVLAFILSAIVLFDFILGAQAGAIP